MLTGSKGWAPPLLHQAITDSQFGQQNAWSGRLDLNLFAQFAGDDAQVMRVIEVRATLNLLHDLLTCHNLAGFLRENLQHPDISFNRRTSICRQSSRSGWPN